MRGALLLLAVPLLLALLGEDAAASSDTTSASELDFFAPAAIRAEGVEHRSALFGASDFGVFNKVKGRVAPFVEDPPQPLGSCPSSSDAVDPSASGLESIALLDGWTACRFVAEATFAQYSVGAKGMLVMENRCLAKNKDKTAAFKQHCDALCNGAPENECYLQKFNYMGGEKHDIQIPSMLISRWDGMRLLECFREQKDGNVLPIKITDVDCSSSKEPPMVEIRWNIQQEDVVEYELWTSSLLNADLFVKDFWWKRVVPLLQNADFSPRYFVWAGEDYSCRYEDGQTPPPHCDDACHNNGRYCHLDPDGLDAGQISGKDISRENVRQLCLFKQLSGSKIGEIRWWHYISDFAMNCTQTTTTEHPYSEDCSRRVHESLGLDWSKTMACVTNSGGYATHGGKNTILEEELKLRGKLEIQKLPTLIVHGKIVDFGGSLKNVLSAICAGFTEASQPEFCPCVQSSDLDRYVDQSLIEKCLEYTPPPVDPTGNGNKTTGGSDSSSGTTNGNAVPWSTFWIVLIILVAGLLGGFYVYRKREHVRLRSEFRDDIRNIMGEYVRMEQDGTVSESHTGSFLGERIGTTDQGGVEMSESRPSNSNGYSQVDNI